MIGGPEASGPEWGGGLNAFIYSDQAVYMAPHIAPTSAAEGFLRPGCMFANLLFRMKKPGAWVPPFH